MVRCGFFLRCGFPEPYFGDDERSATEESKNQLHHKDSHANPHKQCFLPEPQDPFREREFGFEGQRCAVYLRDASTGRVLSSLLENNPYECSWGIAFGEIFEVCFQILGFGCVTSQDRSDLEESEQKADRLAPVLQHAWTS